MSELWKCYKVEHNDRTCEKGVNGCPIRHILEKEFAARHDRRMTNPLTFDQQSPVALITIELRCAKNMPLARRELKDQIETLWRELDALLNENVREGFDGKTSYQTILYREDK